MSRSQKGSIISTEPGYRFQPVNSRARSASGYVDEYYMDSGDERASFICSKPGFVCLAAVLFTVSFISLAFFLETGMPWRNESNKALVPASNQTAGASILGGKLWGRKHYKNPKPEESSSESQEQGATDKGEDADGVKIVSPTVLLQDPQEVIDVHDTKKGRPLTDRPKTVESSGPSTLRPLLPNFANEENDIMHIYTPFDDKRHTQNRALRALMDSQGYGKECGKDFTFHDLIEFMQIPSSSESVEENNFVCKDLTDVDFDQMTGQFKNKMRRNAKYLFLVRDPRSLIATSFDKHGGSFVNCVDDQSHRCLYDEEVLDEAQQKMEHWNNRTQQMIQLCHKLGPHTCQLVRVERLVVELADTLESLGKFLVMDFEKDTFRILNKMVQKVDDGSVDGNTEKERLMVNFLEFLLTDTSGVWPWVGKLPYNVFAHMKTWAPLMEKLGYGFDTNVPYLREPLNLEKLIASE